jgi:hypothetical protein
MWHFWRTASIRSFLRRLKPLLLYQVMKITTLILIVSSVIARAEDEGVEFYFSQMRWSSNPDPVDAGAIDGAYYADLMMVGPVCFRASFCDTKRICWRRVTIDRQVSAARRFELSARSPEPEVTLRYTTSRPLFVGSSALGASFGR